MNKQELRERVLDIFQGCDGGFYRVTIETDDFSDEIEYQLDEEALYTALGFDWEKLGEMKDLLNKLEEVGEDFSRSERLLASYDYGKKPWAKEDYEQAKEVYEQIEKEYEDFIAALGDEADKYKKYADIDWVWWEETPSFEKMLDYFVEDLEEIIKNNELKNYRIY
ncbi:hypothetical protein NHG29_03220 [Aerococcaceae bacterium NML160702]|nr:hypothetical protein [Aerococcaceae bacterium NML160702]